MNILWSPEAIEYLNSLWAYIAQDNPSAARAVALHFCIFGRQVEDTECEGTQAIEADNPVLIIDGNGNSRHIAFLVLAGT